MLFGSKRSMLVLLPVTILILGALVVIILHRSQPGFGYSWLVALGISLTGWLAVLLLHWYYPAPFVFSSWCELGGQSSSLLFVLDNASGPYALSLVSVMLAVVITAPANLQDEMPSYTWASILMITGTGLLAIFAGNPLTLVLAWTSVDLIELVLILANTNDGRLNRRAVGAFAVRVMGTFVIIWTMSLSRFRGMALSLDAVTPELGLYLLLAAGLRLGVVPLYISYSHEFPMRRGYGTVLRLVAPASSLVLLARLPDLVMPVRWAVMLSAFTAIAVVYGAAMWLAADDELDGRPYWLISLAGMAVACVVRGQTAASMSWGVVLLLSGSLLFLYSARHQKILVIPLLGLLGITGLPYSPAVLGWKGLIVFPFNVLDILFLFGHTLLLVGYLRHALKGGESFVDLDGWIQLVYPLGLAVLVLSHWIIGAGLWDTGFPAGVWWAGIISIVIGVLVYILFVRYNSLGLVQENRFGIISIISQRVGKPLSIVLSFEWFYQFLWVLYRQMQRIARIITDVVEGDGGVLWALLFLALLITLIRAGGFR